jgi:CubicO group peptidase (beta-lactamase class C family)
VAQPAKRFTTATPAQIRLRIERYVDSFAKTGLFSGVVLVERDGKVLLSKAYGIGEKGFGVPMTVDTRFQIASLSKPITSAAIGRLVDQHKLTYETKVGDLVPGIPNGDRITIEQLLTHHSGLLSPDQLPGSGEWMRLPQTTQQLVDRIKSTKPLFEPGERYQYSNANYWLLAHLIEKLSGESYGAFLRKEIFEPLGMKSTGHRGDLLAIVPNLAPGYQPDGPSRWRIAELIDWTSKTGNGSLYSTAGDLSRFYHGLLEGRLLSAATTARVIGEGKDYGFGWFHRDKKELGHASIRFNGRSPGYSSYLEVFVKERTSFIILSNLYAYAPTAMADGLGAILWDKPYKAQQPLNIVPMAGATLRSFEGTYQFSADFFLRNGQAKLVGDGDHLKMRWSAGGLTTVLLPTSQDSFFDPTFWAKIRIVDEGGRKVIKYQAYGFSTIYDAPQLP